MAKYKVKVDRELCIGAATCVAVAPKVFELDSEGKAVILKKDQTKTSDFVEYENIDDSEENILNAAKSCPVDAIVIVEVDDAGKEIRQVCVEQVVSEGWVSDHEIERWFRVPGSRFRVEEDRDVGG